MNEPRPDREENGAPEREETQLRPSPGLIALGVGFLILGILAGLFMSAATFR